MFRKFSRGKIFLLYWAIGLCLIGSIFSTRSSFSGIINFALADTVLFQDGYESGQDSLGNFYNWDGTPVYGGAGTARAVDDTLIVYQGRHSARFELSDGSRGGWAYTSKRIPWPLSNKLWYRCSLRNGPHSQSNVVVGGLYFLEAYIVHPSGYRERANLETHPRSQLPDSQFILRMAYRGRDGQRHRQQTNIPILNREQWYRVKMLVDLSGDDPYYAWWLNDSLIWFEYDTSVGDDTLPPTDFHAGACWIDWSPGNRAQVWIDSCVVIAEGAQGLHDRLAPNLYPYPIGNQQTILGQIPDAPTTPLRIYDYSGRAVKLPLHLNSLPPGVYFIVDSAATTYAVKKAVFFH